jgi:hypothetical protein
MTVRRFEATNDDDDDHGRSEHDRWQGPDLPMGARMERHGAVFPGEAVEVIACFDSHRGTFLLAVTASSTKIWE